MNPFPRANTTRDRMTRKDPSDMYRSSVPAAIKAALARVRIRSFRALVTPDLSRRILLVVGMMTKSTMRVTNGRIVKMEAVYINLSELPTR
jgi:hypothetical protein